MRKAKQRLIFSLFILSIFNGITMAADSPCGDWEPYKDENCFKIFDKVVTEEEAEKICSQQENTATLVTIHSKDEQDFLSNLLFKTHKVVDAVWIGAKYSSNKFKWIDDSDLSFTNWAEGSPKNKTDWGCVQMIQEGSSVGKWADEPCSKNNKVVCSKMQNWSIPRLQKTFLDTRKKLEDSLENVTKKLNNQQSTINSQQSTINDLKQNPVPIGFIYAQLPGQPDPRVLWPTVVWGDISSEYAGLFFRVQGGGAAPFGETQSENSPRLIHAISQGVNRKGIVDYVLDINILANGDWSGTPLYSGGSSSYDYGIRFKVSSGEVRPHNKAMRIWKRIK